MTNGDHDSSTKSYMNLSWHDDIGTLELESVTVHAWGSRDITKFKQPETAVKDVQVYIEKTDGVPGYDLHVKAHIPEMPGLPKDKPMCDRTDEQIVKLVITAIEQQKQLQKVRDEADKATKQAADETQKLDNKRQAYAAILAEPGVQFERLKYILNLPTADTHLAIRGLMNSGKVQHTYTDDDHGYYPLGF